MVTVMRKMWGTAAFPLLDPAPVSSDGAGTSSGGGAYGAGSDTGLGGTHGQAHDGSALAYVLRLGEDLSLLPHPPLSLLLVRPPLLLHPHLFPLLLPRRIRGWDSEYRL